MFEAAGEFDHYRVADTIYDGRPARVLYGGQGLTAQSGVAKDAKPQLLFDYNERLMELVRGIRPRSLLLIGGGAFTMPLALNRELPDLQLDIVELDPKLLDIARRFFNFKQNGNTQVFIGDGRQFIDTIDHIYDMIIMDVFVQADVPSQFRTDEATAGLRQILNKKGVLVINIIGAMKGIRATTLLTLHQTWQAAFANVTIFPASPGLSRWMGQNFVMTAQSGQRDLTKFIPYSPIDIK